jgi:hypothetical protein
MLFDHSHGVLISLYNELICYWQRIVNKIFSTQWRGLKKKNVLKWLDGRHI